ncbi:amidohydrolase [Listeria ivanovii]|uniref:amidohydrolase n=1 Tax=Listeria ivanovii TaxID=1638 RepID=UPI001FB4DAE6|nr:amidohydrolase [Listeria ivanovii]MCJ1717132.1 amidohydrolase [Listeria ivanovii]MCJ1722341.1 amidohydrolase [Listeria ivanovii]MCJ1735021.1 amidohydrolase [Listeria ivanovii]
MRAQLMKMLDERKAEIIQIRRHLHENPELSFHETETAKYIQDFYKGKDVEVATDIGNGHAVVVTIKGGKRGKTIALRADFDALPVTEETGLPFKSKNEGGMHACGHDGHTAYMLVLADCLISLKENIPGVIKIVHQHAEETPPGGAKSVVESGILNDVDQIFGIHVFPFGDSGEVYYHSGYSMAGRTYFKLKIQGVGGHGSSPHMANDAIVASAYFVTAVQTIISRRLNPFDTGVVTIGSFDGKGSFNVIKDAVELEGDVRYMNTENRNKIDAEIHRIVAGIEAMFGVTTELTYTNDYPPLYNDPNVTEQVVASLQKGVGEYLTAVSEYEMLSGSEDFAYYLEKIPGVFFYIGAKPKNTEQAYFNHHPKFDIDEDALLVAAKSVAEVVLDYYKLD